MYVCTLKVTMAYFYLYLEQVRKLQRVSTGKLNQHEFIRPAVIRSVLRNEISTSFQGPIIPKPLASYKSGSNEQRSFVE